MERKGWEKGHNDKYNIDYMTIQGFMGGVTCEFSFNDRRYGFTARPGLKPLDKNAKKGTLNVETNEEALNRELENILNYLILNEKEKKAEKRIDKIDSEKYIVFSINEKSQCFYKGFTTSNENINKCLNPYVHDGMVETYFIIRTEDFEGILSKEENELYFSYNPYFCTLDFESINEAGHDLYVKNEGNECMLFRSYLGVMFVRPGEIVKYCKKNIYKGKITCPTCYGRDITDEKEEKEEEG